MKLYIRFYEEEEKNIDTNKSNQGKNHMSVLFQYPLCTTLESFHFFLLESDWSVVSRQVSAGVMCTLPKLGHYQERKIKFVQTLDDLNMR